MKRLSLLGFIGMMATLLAGCPIYDDDGEWNEGPCPSGDCSNPNGCNDSNDCGVNETCGRDNECHTGDCTIWGCTSDFECVIEGMQASCQPGGTGGTGGTGGSGGTGGTGGVGGSGGSGGSVTWCGNPDDCPMGETCAPDGTCHPGTCDTVGCIYGYACEASQCVPQNPAACGTDADCSALGAGYACVSGVCTAPADQCTDQTQCPANNKCVDGKCTPACNDNADCDGGYTCDPVGVCTVPAKPCTITNDCGSADEVCVDGACVPRSQMGMCPPGDVWVENGCIPNQTAAFYCNQDGVQDACAAGSICLHHACYISCAPPNDNACNNLPSFDVCKPVSTMSGDHQVCGSNDNLGNECDPTAGLACASGKICIDGFCK
ncbi:hypothetical protein [Polyangium fumosum]|nr:hypothetical protein [Polyangium fumosum]